MGWVVGATCSSGPLFGLCSYARGWLTPAKLIRDLRKTRSLEAKAQARQTNTCQLPLATITFNIFGVEIQQHNSWRPLLTREANTVLGNLVTSSIGLHESNDQCLK